MKGFAIPLLGVIFVTLIASSVQSTSADHLEPGQGIFKDEKKLNKTQTIGEKYQIHLQVVTRNEDGQLIYVSEATYGQFIPHKVTDYAFDKLMGKKEIISIDNIMYEKVQYTYIPTLEHRFAGIYPIFTQSEFIKNDPDLVAKMNTKTKNYTIFFIHSCVIINGHGLKCVPIFDVFVPYIELEPRDNLTLHWTILRELN